MLIVARRSVSRWLLLVVLLLVMALSVVACGGYPSGPASPGTPGPTPTLSSGY
jgi:hypothetical protein